jgi:hypothetical protein
MCVRQRAVSSMPIVPVLKVDYGAIIRRQLKYSEKSLFHCVENKPVA